MGRRHPLGLALKRGVQNPSQLVPEPNFAKIGIRLVLSPVLLGTKHMLREYTPGGGVMDRSQLVSEPNTQDHLVLSVVVLGTKHTFREVII